MKSLYPLMVSIFLVSCTNFQQSIQEPTVESSTNKMVLDESSSIKPAFAFSLPDIGAYSAIEVPENVKVIPSSRFISAQEPTFAQMIGHEIRTVDYEKFCSETDMSLSYLSGIVMNCKIIDSKFPHIEYYFAHYNPYTQDYFLIGKYALFRTYSKVYPALLVWMPKQLDKEIDLSSAEQIKSYFSTEMSSTSHGEQEQAYDDFARSIDIRPIENEQEWLLHIDNELNYSIEYPAGVGFPYDGVYGTGTSIGVDGQYTVTFFKDEDSLNKLISSIGTQYKDRKEIRTITQISSYEAEKVVIHPMNTPRYIVPSKYGFFLLSFHSYEPEDDMYINHMLSSFNISE